MNIGEFIVGVTGGIILYQVIKYMLGALVYIITDIFE